VRVRVRVRVRQRVEAKRERERERGRERERERERERASEGEVDNLTANVARDDLDGTALTSIHGCDGDTSPPTAPWSFFRVGRPADVTLDVFFTGAHTPPLLSLVLAATAGRIVSRSSTCGMLFTITASHTTTVSE
jgi:hypothetical protein